MIYYDYLLCYYVAVSYQYMVYGHRPSHQGRQVVSIFLRVTASRPHGIVQGIQGHGHG